MTADELISGSTEVTHSAPIETPRPDWTSTIEETCPTCGSRLDKAIDVRRRTLQLAGEGEQDFIGKTIGNYCIDEQVGEGGVGEVYRATHIAIGNEVAIKVLRTEVCGIDGASERFAQEVKAASVIDHPGVSTYYDFGWISKDRPYAVMEFLRGETVADRLKSKGRFSVAETAFVIEETARAMRAAHHIGIIHRDLKPENLFLSLGPDGKEQLKVLDFGIAKVTGVGRPQVNLTRVGTFVGTPQYCAPEQAYAGDVGPETDVYAIGAMAFELLFGQPPFVGNDKSILMAKTSEDAPELATLRPDIPARVSSDIAAMLQRDPALRWNSMDDIEQAVSAWAPPPVAPSVPAEAPTTRSPSHGWLWWLAATVGFFSLLAFAFVAGRLSSVNEAPPLPASAAPPPVAAEPVQPEEVDLLPNLAEPNALPTGADPQAPDR